MTRVKIYHAGGRSLFALHLALSEPPQYRAVRNHPPVNVGFSQEMFGGSVQDQVRDYQEIAAGGLSRREMLQIAVRRCTILRRLPPASTPRLCGNLPRSGWRLKACRLEEPEGGVRRAQLGSVGVYAPNMTRDKVLAMTIQDRPTPSG